MLTLVVPTRNRVHFLRGLLDYWASLDCRYPVVIGDSSDEPQVAANRETIHRVSGRLHVTHQLYPPYAQLLPGIGTIVCMQDLLTAHVDTKYAVFAPDDDFLVPNALDEAVRYLETHPDYSAVHGKAVLMFSDHGSCGDSYAVEPYAQRGYAAPSPLQRLQALLGTYTTSEFAVKRTERMRAQWVATVRAEFGEQMLGELLRSCLTVIEGKTYILPRLYLVRQGHAQRTSWRSPDVFDRLVTPRWPHEYEQFRSAVATALHHATPMSVADARDAVKEAFWTYMVHSLVAQQRLVWPTSHPQHSSVRRNVAHWLTSVGERPALRRTWRRLRAHLPGEHNAFSFRALLHPSSPYHPDFLPVYQAMHNAS